MPLPSPDIDRFYDGPPPEDLDRAIACGGWPMLARLRARHDSRRCDTEMRLILARRRRGRPRPLDRTIDPTDQWAVDRSFEVRLALFRIAGLAACMAAAPETRGET
jgi:hypothetical protein